jgi:hypothetical protein
MSIGLTFNTTLSDIVITEDFNIDMQKHTSAAKINSIATHYHLIQLIQQQTHYNVDQDITALFSVFLIL